MISWVLMIAPWALFSGMCRVAAGTDAEEGLGTADANAGLAKGGADVGVAGGVARQMCPWLIPVGQRGRGRRGEGGAGSPRNPPA
jgi:hypothetical protein